ncbi:MAG: AMP-binding protein [Clostridiales bacterium]
MNKGIKITESDGNRIIKGTGYYEPKRVCDLRELVKGSIKNYKDRTAFKFKNKSGEIIEKSYIDLDKEIDYLGTSLISLGLKGKKIAILSENRYEWGLSYFSIVNGTGIVVPLDKYLPHIEVENLIKRGKVEGIFYSASFQNSMKEIASLNNTIKYFICLDEMEKDPDNRFISLFNLLEKGEKLLKEGDKNFVKAEINKDEMSMILFTSGTTSVSKGVMLSHSNVANNVTALTTIIKVYPTDVHLSLLPLHHTFENTIGLMFMIHCGVCIAYSDGIKHIGKNLKEYNVSIIVAVPNIFEAMYKKIQDGIKNSGKENLVNFLIKFSDILKGLGIDIKKTLFKGIIREISPNLRLLVTGAAPINAEIVRGFNKLGLKMLQGYGLTETSPVISATNDFIDKAGTIGYPINEVEVKIDDPDEDGIGELLTKGKNVMLGYYENQDATDEAIDDDGWFRTGDLANIDEDGFVKITGRAKSMIVLANGKKAFPEEYEFLLGDYEEIKESYVWGFKTSEGNIQICAKIVLNKDIILKDGQITEEKIANKVKEIIKNINKIIPRYKIIRYFLLTYDELIKTTTLKVKRPLEDKAIKELLSISGYDMRKASGKFIDSLLTYST